MWSGHMVSSVDLDLQLLISVDRHLATIHSYYHQEMKEDITSFFIFILLPLILSYFFLLVGVNACEKQCTRNIRCEFLSQEFIGLRVDLYTIVDENLCH